MSLAEWDFELPPEQIARAPLARRDACRLLVLPRDGGAPEHRVFADLRALLPAGALLVLNETRVIPARLLGRRATGGKVEVLLVEPRPDGDWDALVRAGGALRPPDEEVTLEPRAGGAADAAPVRLRVVERLAPGRYRVRFPPDRPALEVADALGHMPLPPYLGREDEPADREAYQTVFAREPGAIAAPTAGLHFTPELLAALEAGGVEVARLVLHVGLGTFAPVRAERLEEHVMHAERYAIPAATAGAVEAARRAGRPVVACGTTTVRALEAWARSGVAAGVTDIFIRPPWTLRAVDGIITNFHLPRTTLLALVAAFVGRERLLAAYAEAIGAGYRFYSYGDAMLAWRADGPPSTQEPSP